MRIYKYHECACILSYKLQYDASCSVMDYFTSEKFAIQAAIENVCTLCCDKKRDLAYLNCKPKGKNCTNCKTSNCFIAINYIRPNLSYLIFTNFLSRTSLEYLENDALTLADSADVIQCE